jgi:hypothetical protein
MSNMRIVYDNVANATSQLTASTTSGTLVAANLLTELKGQVHRSTGTSVTYTARWAADQRVGCVALPCTNLTATATMRVRLFSDTNATALVADSGTVTAVPGFNLDPKLWPTARNANSFAFGGGVKAVQWFTSQPTNIRAVIIDLVDTSNPAGYIDCSRLVIGDYWSPTYNIQNGVQLEIADNSQTSRRDSGDLITDRSFVYDNLTFDFSLLTDFDKNNLTRIIRNVGTHDNIFVSLFPADPSQTTNHDSSIYGKRSTNSAVTYQLYSYYAHQMQLTGW